MSATAEAAHPKDPKGRFAPAERKAGGFDPSTGLYYVSLTKGHRVIVDGDDYKWLRQFCWHIHETQNGHLYAKGRITWEGKRIFPLMHRLIMGPPEGMQVDHINGDGLDNRRCNLRIATNAQNQRNCKHKGGASGYKGVHLARSSKAWVAEITFNYRKIILGHFKSKEDAARVYNVAASFYFGEFAKLNVIPEVA